MGPRCGDMRFIWGLGLLAVFWGPAVAEDITVDDLQGVTIHTSTSYVGRFRNDLGEAPGGFTTIAVIKIRQGTAIRTKFTRNTWADTPRGRKTGSFTRTGKGEIAKPWETKSSPGSALWLIEGDTLVAFRVYEVGGSTMRIKFEKTSDGLSCTVDAPVMREVGAGATTDKSAMAMR